MSKIKKSDKKRQLTDECDRQQKQKAVVGRGWIHAQIHNQSSKSRGISQVPPPPTHTHSRAHTQTHAKTTKHKGSLKSKSQSQVKQQTPTHIHTQCCCVVGAHTYMIVLE